MVRTFTPAEAAAILPRVRPLLAQLRDATHEHRFAMAQVEELQAFGLAAREGPERAEAEAWARRAGGLEARIGRLLAELAGLGVEVKDPLLGLVDLHARRADGTLVYLCYRDDEPTIAHWHPLDTGFAGRRPLSEL